MMRDNITDMVNGYNTLLNKGYDVDYASMHKTVFINQYSDAHLGQYMNDLSTYFSNLSNAYVASVNEHDTCLR